MRDWGKVRLDSSQLTDTDTVYEGAIKWGFLDNEDATYIYRTWSFEVSLIEYLFDLTDFDSDVSVSMEDNYGNVFTIALPEPTVLKTDPIADNPYLRLGNTELEFSDADGLYTTQPEWLSYNAFLRKLYVDCSNI